jgi:Tfp pilus assembly protein PilO
MDLRNPRVQRGILAGLAGVGLLYAYFFTNVAPFAYPRRKAILRDLVAQGDKLERQVQTDRAAVQDRAHLEADVAALQARWLVESAIVPVSAPPDEVLRELSVAAQEANVSLAMLKPESPKSGGDYVTFPAKLDVSGRYADVALFLEKIASCQRLLVVPTMKMAGVTNDKTGGVGNPSVRVSMQLVAYAQKGGKS